MDEFILPAMLLVIFGGTQMYVFGMSLWIGIKHTHRFVMNRFKK